MPYCGAVVPESYSTVTLFDGDIGGNPNDDPLIVSQPNTVRSRELNLNDISGGCSEVGQGTVEMRIEGESSDKLVVFVVDLSLSMDNTPPDQGYPLEDEDYYAVNLMAEKLAGPIGSYPDPSDESNTDVFSTIWRKANAVEDANTSVKIAMVGFHSYAWLWDASGRTHSYRYINSVNDVSDDYFFDITNEADLTTLRTIAYNRFNPLPETNILDGLNLADWLLQYSEREDPDSGRNVILLSDGKPEISRSVRADTCWNNMCNCYNYDGPSYLCPCLRDCGGGGGGWEPITFLDDWGKQIKTESEADFKIAITEPVLEGEYYCNHDRDDDEEEDCPYACWDGVPVGGEPDPNVPQNECCRYRDLLPDRLYRSVCTISNIDEEAGDIKEMSELYSIYYDTGHTEAETNAQNMCLWSSEENSLCNPYDPLENDYTFAFASSDIDSLFDSVVSGIFSKPGDIFVNDQSISDPEPEELVSEQILCLNDPDDTGGVGCMANLTDVDCSLESFYSQYMEGYGEVSYTDLFLNYCPAKLHQ
jgi:hypothetical protein